MGLPLGSFLISISSAQLSYHAEERYQNGLKVIGSLKSQEIHQTIQVPGLRVATFRWHERSAGRISFDETTQSRLLAFGTWFHSSGYGIGSEDRLLRRYLEVGAKHLGRELEGFFLLMIADGRTSDTLLLTDIMGSCHAFQRSWNGQTMISSSSLALAAIEQTRLDPVGCQEFLQTGISYERRTLYCEVLKLEPATLYQFADGAATGAERYWNIADLSPDSLSDGLAVDALWAGLSQATRNIARDFPHPICDLTGGYDSRAVLAGFTGTNTPISAAVSGPPDGRDVQISRALAHSIDIPHVHLFLKDRFTFPEIREAHALTDGEFDPVEYAQILHVQRSLSTRFDISLNGSYGGIARALWWELLFPHIGSRRPLDAHRLARGRYISPRYDASLFRPELRINLVDHLAGVVSRCVEELSGLPNTLQMDYANLSMRIQRWQGRIASSTHQVWHCLSPFGLRTVLETVLQTDSRLRLRSKLVRRMLARYQPRLADFPLDRGYPAAPVTIRNFYRFAPVIVHFVGRASSKLQRMWTGGTAGSASSGPLPVRLQLWQDEQVRSIFSAKPLKSECVLDSHALRGFVERSRMLEFPWPEQWNRLLSLEYTLDTLARLGASPRAPE